MRVTRSRQYLAPYAVRPVIFQTTAMVGKPYCLGPRWHLPAMRCAADDVRGGSSPHTRSPALPCAGRVWAPPPLPPSARGGLPPRGCMLNAQGRLGTGGSPLGWMHSRPHDRLLVEAETSVRGRCRIKFSIESFAAHGPAQNIFCFMSTTELPQGTGFCALPRRIRPRAISAAFVRGLRQDRLLALAVSRLLCCAALCQR